MLGGRRGHFLKIFHHLLVTSLPLLGSKIAFRPQFRVHYSKKAPRILSKRKARGNTRILGRTYTQDGITSGRNRLFWCSFGQSLPDPPLP